MTVTKIEPMGKTRYKVYLDERYAFALYKGELSRYRLAVGEVLEPEAYQTIRCEIVLKRAKLRAMHLLTDMGRTESQLRRKLVQGGYPEDIADEALAYVKSFGYLNDLEYARSFIGSRKEKKSQKEIYAVLCQKGVAKELIEEAMESCYEREDSVEAIRALMRKKNFNPENAEADSRRKMLSYLVRKGFSYEDVRQVIQVSEWNA